MFEEEKFKVISKYAQMHIVQLIGTAILSLAMGFLVCKAVTKPCVREIVCKEIIVDRDKLSDQLNNSRKECLDDKSEFGKSLKVRLTNDCNNRVKDAIKNCDFSEKHHCPICKARGICK